ncbi:MAG: DUF3987 domain-containing protein, partial [Planctomycetia bacterium]|nr:DUF3987 domain-containing protein [Planctomycetia bacterium]
MNKLKGIDDLLAAGRKPRRLKGKELEEHLAKVRAKFIDQFAEAPEPAKTTLVPPPEQRPAFPVDVFPIKVATFAQRVADSMRCPLDFPGLGILVVSGAARALQLKGGWWEKPGLYAVIVNRPGTTKTPALRAVMTPVYDKQDQLAVEHKAALKQYEDDLEAYKDAKHDHEEGEPLPVQPDEPAPLRHLFANDTTVESLAANLAENRKGILLFRDELTAWVRSLDQYKVRGTDRQFFLSTWSGEMVKVDRKYAHGQPTIIRDPFVSVLGGIQPDMLTELQAEGGKEDGFIHRVLFAYPADSQAQEWSDAAISDEDQQEWKLVLNRLLNLEPVKPEGTSERPKRLEFSAEGKAAYITWHNQLVSEMNQADFPRELWGPCSKLKAHCARFALILHLLRVACGEAGDAHCEGEVDEHDVAGAIKLCDYFKAHSRLVYGPRPTHHLFPRIPSPRRISSRKSVSRPAAYRFLARLSVDGWAWSSDTV